MEIGHIFHIDAKTIKNFISLHVFPVKMWWFKYSRDITILFVLATVVHMIVHHSSFLKLIYYRLYSSWKFLSFYTLYTSNYLFNAEVGKTML